jgi:hypothetical protein
MSEVQHGCAASYESGKCRCPDCREAGMAARRRQRERRRQLVAAGDVSHVVHGTWAAYTTDGCRCEECRALKSSYMKAYRAREREGAEGEREQGRPTAS